MKQLVAIISFLIFVFAYSYGRTINVPSAHATIQDAINSANDGDTVLVPEGTYYENINFKGKAITVASYFIIDQDTSHISKTIINGSRPSNPESGSVVTFNSDEDTTSMLCGFTITGGTGTRVITPVNPFIHRRGGGIYLVNSGAKICNNNITNNRTYDFNNRTYNLNVNQCGGGGIASGPPEVSELLIIKNNIIQDNTCSNASGSNYGAGLYILSNSKIISNIIRNNTLNSFNQFAKGGGIFIAEIDSVLIKNNIITNNKIEANSDKKLARGGGINLQDMGNSKIRIIGNTILTNEVSNNNIAFGGGISVTNTNGDVVFSKNYLLNNIASFGGGIHLEKSNVKIIGNIIADNKANISGGGVETKNTTNPEIMNNLIAQNSAKFNGGGINFLNTDGVLINNTIVKNNSLCGGGGITADKKSNPIILNTIICGNQAEDFGGNQVYIGDEDSSPSFMYCDIENGFADFDFFFERSEFSGTYEFNIEVEPLFVEGNPFCCLSSTSTCVGNGIDSIDLKGTKYKCPTTDLFGNPRPNPVDEHVDIGAIESSFPRVDPTSINLISNEVPKKFKLSQNYPNPFNPSTVIQYQIPKRTHPSILSREGKEWNDRGVLITLKVYDILGREVTTLINKKQNSGYYKVEWNADSQPSGVYFYTIIARDPSASSEQSFVATKKMILLR